MSCYSLSLSVSKKDRLQNFYSTFANLPPEERVAADPKVGPADGSSCPFASLIAKAAANYDLPLRHSFDAYFGSS
jgi:hypothetical protein